MMKWLKWLLFSVFILTITCEPVFSQKIRFPTNVRYIAGGYTAASRPYFSTLESALNDVKAFATSGNPYVFWVDSDTLWIADWDSVKTGSTLTMKDSIDVHYVATGKIKWSGFGFGGSGGGGTTAISDPEGSTLHYDFWTWTGQSNLATWQDRLGENADSIDQRIWELIVYTDSVYLYIENDTLKFRSGSISVSGWNPDTTTVLRTTGNQSKAGNLTMTAGGHILASGSWLQLPPTDAGSGNNLWRTAAGMWYSDGVDTFQVMMRDEDDGLMVDSLITWQNLADAVKDSIELGVGRIFHEFFIYSDDPDTVELQTGGGWLVIKDWTPGESSGLGTATDSSVTVVTPGTYKIDYSVSFTGSNSQIIECGIFIDDVLDEGSGFWRKLGTGTDVGSASGTVMVTLALDEVVEIKLRSPGTTGDVIVHIANINTVRIK